MASHVDGLATHVRDLSMKDSPPVVKLLGRPWLRSPMEDRERSRRPESPISDMELDDPSCGGDGVVLASPRPRCGSLVLRCVDCSSVVLVGYGQGAVPVGLHLTDLSQRSNGVALTTCPRCFRRASRGLHGRSHPVRAQYPFARNPTMCPALWNASDFVRAAALVLEEPVALMMARRVCLHIGWDRVSKTLDARDSVVSLDVSQLATGDAQRLTLPHLTGNWV